MNMQTNRQFEIVYILLDKKNTTAKDLAEHFGVSRRTICRDLDTLRSAGIPLYTERGKGGGIRLLPDFVLNKSLLSDQEQNEILFALQSLSCIKTDDTDRVVRKLSTIFNKSTTSWLEVDFSGWTHENNYFDDFKIAILESRVAEFDYYNSQGDKAHRCVEPVQLLFKSNAWYLKGYCLEKRGIRLYKLSRIKNVHVTEKTFAERELCEISNEPNSNDSNESQCIEVKLRIDPERSYRVFDIFYESMIEKQSDSSHIVTVLWPENNWLYDMILSLGKYVEVIEPEHLREIIKKEAQNISEIYQ